MNRQEIETIMKDVYTSSEAASYLNVSTQKINQLVHDKRIVPIKTSKSILLFLKSDLDKYCVTIEMFDINTPFVRDAILYYTIQQYFNNNDKKTAEFIYQIEETHGFSFQNGLKMNIPLLSKLLNTTDKELYARYGMVKKSFANLTNDVILVKKGEQAQCH